MNGMTTEQVYIINDEAQPVPIGASQNGSGTIAITADTEGRLRTRQHHGGIPAGYAISRPLDTTGDGTGTTNAIGDYSTSPAAFKISPPPGEQYYIYRMLVYVRLDAKNISFAPDKYDNTTALTTGIKVGVYRDGVEMDDYTGGDAVRTSSEWRVVSYDQSVASGAGFDSNHVRWTLTKDFGEPVELIGDELDDLRVTLADDFSALNIDKHYFMIKGHREYPE